jgi:hypothetical protein
MAIVDTPQRVSNIRAIEKDFLKAFRFFSFEKNFKKRRTLEKYAGMCDENSNMLQRGMKKKRAD